MDDKATVLDDVCAALSDNRRDRAGSILQERYPFEPFTNVGREYTERQRVAVFVHDGFVDRYSGMRLIFPATLRLISKRLPDQFPYHKNWRTDACHFAYWHLYPTIDHIEPVSRGGKDDDGNWVTTSQLRNLAKGNYTLDEFGWSLQNAGDMREWDGLLRWFMEQARADRTVRDDPALRKWFNAADKMGY